MFAALAVARHLRASTGVTIKRPVRTICPLLTVFIGIGECAITVDLTISPDARAIFDQLPPLTLGHPPCESRVGRP